MDFEEFYATRGRSLVAQEDVLVLSADGKGIVMRPDALRAATAQAAQRASPKLKTRLSRGEKRNRKRIAEVGAVYEITPAVRTAADVLASGEEKTTPAPQAKGKWLTASIANDAASVVADIFAEAERRDPEHQRTWVALVDGNNHQIDRIKAEAKARKVKVTIVIDLVHVLEYLWAAAWCFYEEGDPDAEKWVHEKATAILDGKAGIVAAAIRRKATRLRLHGDKRARADRAADYLLNKRPLPRLPHRPPERLADRDRRHRRRLPTPDQGPHGRHRRPLGPARRRSDPQTPRDPQQQRLRRILDLPPRPRTPPQPRITLRQRHHPPRRVTSLRESRAAPAFYRGDPGDRLGAREPTDAGRRWNDVPATQARPPAGVRHSDPAVLGRSRAASTSWGERARSTVGPSIASVPPPVTVYSVAPSCVPVLFRAGPSFLTRAARALWLLVIHADRNCVCEPDDGALSTPKAIGLPNSGLTCLL